MQTTISILISLQYTDMKTKGRGAVFTADATHEMEASIMNGENLKVSTCLIKMYMYFNIWYDYNCWFRINQPCP